MLVSGQVWIGAFLGTLIFVALSGCQGDYPIDPTPCDDLCHLRDPFLCGSYDPANCVIDCERQGGRPTEDGCREAWDAMLECYATTPVFEDPCEPTMLPPCFEEEQALADCRGNPLNDRETTD